MKRLDGSDVNIVAFPELSLTGYLIKDVAFEVSDRCQEALAEISSSVARNQRCIVGYVRENKPGLIENAAAVVGTNRILGSTAKFYLPTYGLFEEMRYFSSGQPTRDLKVFSIGACRFGVIVCEDAWHPEPAEALARMGCDIIFCISSSPARGIHMTNKRKELPIELQWKTLLGAHALMNNVFMVFVNRAGAEDEEFFWGGSMVISPSGEVMASAKRFRDDLTVVDVDLREVARSRRFSSFKDHKERFHRVLESL